MVGLGSVALDWWWFESAPPFNLVLIYSNSRVAQLVERVEGGFDSCFMFGTFCKDGGSIPSPRSILC